MEKEEAVETGEDQSFMATFISIRRVTAKVAVVEKARAEETRKKRRVTFRHHHKKGGESVSRREKSFYPLGGSSEDITRGKVTTRRLENSVRNDTTNE